MSQGVQGEPTARKKGLRPLAWAGIGCGAIALIGLAVVVVLAVKLKDFAREARQNPARAAAELFARTNPDVEVVRSDDGNGTVTIRNAKTGETVTLDLDDIKQGRLSVLTQEGAIGIEAGGTGGDDGVHVTIETGDAGFEGTAHIGSGTATELPDWVPVYPEADIQMSSAASAGKGDAGSYQFATSDPLDGVLEHFARVLQQQDYEIERRMVTSADRQASGLLHARHAQLHRELSVAGAVGETDARTTVHVSYRMEH